MNSILIATGATGCWSMAIQLAAPVGYQVAEGIGKNVAAFAERDSTRPPGIIELRKSAAGTPEYREVRVDLSANDPTWAAVVDDETAADGWRPAVNFLAMDFTPPLAGALPEQGTNYLAYAPKESDSVNEPDRVAGFPPAFGPPVGTFRYAGQLYEYSLARGLPSRSQLN